MALPDFPVRREIRGIGMSDWHEYAAPLRDLFDYTNTFYHQEPLLDITSPDQSLVGQLDFIISSEVFEHVPAPVSRAFVNSRRLLKPGGVLLLTTPFVIGEGVRTVEHFPNLHDYEIIDGENREPILVNTTTNGIREAFTGLVFHGGPGLALEMRLFSEESLLEELAEAGFVDVCVYREPDYLHGVVFEGPWSLPIAARAPGGSPRPTRSRARRGLRRLLPF